MHSVYGENVFILNIQLNYCNPNGCVIVFKVLKPNVSTSKFTTCHNFLW